jgi:hypothetical protein
LNGNTKRTSPWVYVGVGCGVIVLLGVLAVVGLGVFGYRKAKQMEAEMKDPAARDAKARAVLGGEVPPGYYPIFSLSLPFLMDMTLLGDHPPVEKGGPDQRLTQGFVYIKSLSSGQQEDELKRYFDAKTDDAEVLRRGNIHVNAEETIRRGVLEVPGQTTLYLAQRGSFAMKGNEGSKGLTTLIFIDCPQDAKQRLGIWFGPDPAPEEAVEKVDWTGSVADEAAMREFIGHFHLCGK